MIYQWNNDRLIAAYSAAQAAEVPEEMAPAESSSASAVPAAETPLVVDNTGIILGNNTQGSLTDDMWTLNGRTVIWSSALKAIRDNKALALWGTEYSGTVISVYNPFEVVHAHNSWMEALLRMGVPGLLMSLVFTVLSVFCAAKLLLSPGTVLWKKVIAMLAMCVMASGFLEPYLFITNVYYHVTDFVFFFLTGYLDYWCNLKREQKT